jgi:hypothetical protein
MQQEGSIKHFSTSAEHFHCDILQLGDKLYENVRKET